MLKLHFLNVENGDCIIIECINEPVRTYGVIDCNRTLARPSPARDKLLALGAKELSFVCLTHPDRDHYSGLFDVLAEYRGKIGAFYTFPIGLLEQDESRMRKLAKSYAIAAENGGDDPDYFRKSLEFIEILRYAHKEFLPDKWQEMHGPYNLLTPPGLSDVNLVCLLPFRRDKGPFFQALASGKWPVESDVESNALSVALRVEYKGTSFLLGADAPSNSWLHHWRVWGRDQRTIGSASVKLPHHGSRLDCTPEACSYMFCRGPSEKRGVISANGKSHPQEEVLLWCAHQGIRTYCTNRLLSRGSSVTQLIADADLDPILNRRLVEFSTFEVTDVDPCKGDITVCVDENGEVEVATQFTNICPCDPLFGELFATS